MKTSEIIFKATLEKRNQNYQEDYKNWKYISESLNEANLKQEIKENKNGVKKNKFSYRKKIGTFKNGNPKFESNPGVEKMLESLSAKILRVNTIDYNIEKLEDLKTWMIKDYAKMILSMDPKLQLHFCRDPSRQSFAEIVQISILKGDVSEWLNDVELTGLNSNFWKVNKLKVGKKIVSSGEIKYPKKSEISKKQTSRCIDVEINSEKIIAFGSLKYSEPIGSLTTALQPAEEKDFIKECDRYCDNPKNLNDGVIFFVQTDGTAAELAIPELRKIAKKMKFKNYLDVLKNATSTQKKEFDKSVKKLLKENPYDPKKKKSIGNAWFIPYTQTSRLSKQIGVKGDVNSRENSRGQHPATFPPALPEKCIKVSGIKKGSVVYDPFVGTGTTIVEAVKQGMVGIGTDIDDNFIKFSKKRLLQENSLRIKS